MEPGVFGLKQSSTASNPVAPNFSELQRIDSALTEPGFIHLLFVKFSPVGGAFVSAATC
jgi:hypothetical protein